MGTLALFGLLVAGGSIWLLNQFIGGISPNARRLDLEIKRLQQETSQLSQDLLLLKTEEETELLCLGQVQVTSKKGRPFFQKGIFTTIYHEPAIAYSSFWYTNQDMYLIVARTPEGEIAYYKQKDVINVVLNGQPVGTMRGGTFFSARNARLGMIRPIEPGGGFHVVLGDEDVARISPEAATWEKVTPRIFDYVKRDLSPEERSTFYCILIHFMVTKVVKPI